MSSISIASPGLQAPVAASRMTATNRATMGPTAAQDGAVLPSSVLTLGSIATDEVTYANPKTVQGRLQVPIRAWTSQPRDDISALMARNSSASTGGLADKWRGLGSALLSRFENKALDTINYQQTLVDRLPPEGVDTTATGATEALDAQALKAVKDGAATVNLKIQTQSGQAVALKITVNPGAEGVNAGMGVELSTSGPLSEGEREALSRLAEGLDKALEGLGQPDKLKLDLSGLMDYDSNALASLDLTVENPKADQALSSFKLHLGADQKTVEIKGKAGDVSLNLAAATPLGPANAQQRQSAIDEHLSRFDAAAQRSRADGALLSLFKDAFSQLHTARAGQATTPQDEPLSPVLSRQVKPLQSGLADFEASFGGNFQKTNDRGAINETGRADHEFSQKTEVKRTGIAGDLAIKQTQSEKLDAHSIKSRFGGMLDTSAGNYDILKVKDSSTSTTLIETARNKLTEASRSTEQH